MLSFPIAPLLAGAARLTDAQALELYCDASLHDLGEWAKIVTDRLHPVDFRTYVIDRNINYTNVCTAKCTFCGFRRDHERHIRELGELVTEYVEGGLGAADRARFEAHIAACEHCDAYIEQMRVTLRVVGRIDPDELEPEVERELQAKGRALGLE